ncbi:MAG: sulfatase [Planctomycetota bacterium]
MAYGGIPKKTGETVPEDGPHPGTMGFQEWFSHFNYFDRSKRGIGGLFHNGTAVDPVDGEPCTMLMDRALPWMRKQAAAGQPFFVCIWFPHPHRPHRPMEESIPDGPEDRRHRALMGEMVEVDRQVGRLREVLRAWGIADDTLVWFTSDNGVLEEGTTDDGLTGHKGDLWEGGIRVPAIVEWPRHVRPQRIEDVPASTMDNLPTLLDILGLPTPVRPIDGHSLWPLLSDGETGERPPIPFWRVLRKHAMPPHNATQAAGYQDSHAVLIHGRFKLHRNPWQVGGSKKERRLDGVDWVLYDVIADPAEEHDLLEQQPAVAAAMQRLLLEWQSSATASMMGGL